MEKISIFKIYLLHQKTFFHIVLMTIQAIAIARVISLLVLTIIFETLSQALINHVKAEVDQIINQNIQVEL